MDMKRRAARVIAILAVALGAGHFVQNMGGEKAPRQTAANELKQAPKAVETVAAGADLTKPATPKAAEKQTPLPAEPLTQSVTPQVKPAPAPAAVAEVTPPAAVVEPAPAAPVLATVTAVPEATKPAPVPAAQPQTLVVETRSAEPPTPEQLAPEQLAPEQLACDITLDLMAEPSAMIGITLNAPCNANQRVVLSHGGLVVTGQTTANGSLFTALPAMETDALVAVAFADGAKAEATLAMPDLASLRRFGVQWQADDAFQVHAFEDGATYGTPGHVSAADPHRPVAGQPAAGGFLTLAGDSTTENPLLAEIYTFPADPQQKPEIIVEAAVTDLTCGRELLGETLTTTGGTTFVTDLTLAMPDCGAIGDYLVLKNLVPDLNMAAAN